MADASATLSSPAAGSIPAVGSTPPVSSPSVPATPPSAPATTPEGGADTPKAPSSFKFKFDDDGAETEVQLEDSTAPPEVDSFKFADLDAIKDSHGDLHKSLKRQVSERDRYSKGFKTPEDQKAHLDRVSRIEESLARPDRGQPNAPQGLDAIEATLGDLATAVVGIQSGDDAVIGKMFDANPAGMSQSASKIMAQWMKRDENAATAFLTGASMAALDAKDASGTSAIDALNKLYDTVAMKDPAAKALLERVAYTVNQFNEKSAWKPDPAAAQQTAAQQLAQREAGVWNKEVDLATAPVIRQALRKGLSDLTSQLQKQLTGKSAPSTSTSWRRNSIHSPGRIRSLARSLASLVTAARRISRRSSTW